LENISSNQKEQYSEIERETKHSSKLKKVFEVLEKDPFLPTEEELNTKEFLSKSDYKEYY
jgi:hypothetical protein